MITCRDRGGATSAGPGLMDQATAEPLPAGTLHHPEWGGVEGPG